MHHGTHAADLRVVSSHERSPNTRASHLLFDGLRDLFGAPLNTASRSDILRFFNFPTKFHWHEIHNLIIADTGFLDTPWKIWIHVDSTAPRSLSLDDYDDWPRVPDADALRAAMRELSIQNLLRPPQSKRP